MGSFYQRSFTLRPTLIAAFVGWHNDASGMRVCHQDCDNPEIPGSGARCRDVNFMGMPMRECVTGGW